MKLRINGKSFFSLTCSEHSSRGLHLKRFTHSGAIVRRIEPHSVVRKSIANAEIPSLFAIQHKYTVGGVGRGIEHPKTWYARGDCRTDRQCRSSTRIYKIADLSDLATRRSPILLRNRTL